jgi:hypothetical protein
MTDSLPEFAEQYGTAERIRWALFGTLAGIAVTCAGKFWLFPWLREFASSSPCRTVFGSPGTTVLWYGVFTGLPLFAAVAVAGAGGWRGFKILRDGQSPPLHEKVFQRTRIQRGGRAKLIGFLHAIAFVPFLALSLWGSGQAAALSGQAQQKPAGCAAHHPTRP